LEINLEKELENSLPYSMNVPLIGFYLGLKKPLVVWLISSLIIWNSMPMKLLKRCCPNGWLKSTYKLMKLVMNI
jgi:hypothetical protein